MIHLKYKKELYSKVAILKAAYNFSDKAYLHLDADRDYYYIDIVPKDDDCVLTVGEFENEILAQSVRHEVYQNTKNIRELIMARALATTVITEKIVVEDEGIDSDSVYKEEDILKDWFSEK